MWFIWMYFLEHVWIDWVKWNQLLHLCPAMFYVILTWMPSLFLSLFNVKLLQLEYCCSVLQSSYVCVGECDEALVGTRISWLEYFSNFVKLLLQNLFDKFTKEKRVSVGLLYRCNLDKFIYITHILHSRIYLCTYILETFDVVCTVHHIAMC